MWAPVRAEMTSVVQRGNWEVWSFNRKLSGVPSPPDTCTTQVLHLRLGDHSRRGSKAQKGFKSQRTGSLV